MSALRFLSHLRLLPRIWRLLVKEALGEIEFERKVAEFAKSDRCKALDIRRAKLRAKKDGKTGLEIVE